eukprot:scaffold241941_cov40-Prasinocladus_malaysianus.AAC.2
MCVIVQSREVCTFASGKVEYALLSKIIYADRAGEQSFASHIAKVNSCVALLAKLHVRAQ